MIDILVLYQLFVPYKWVSKKENFSIPIIGWLMRLNEYLELVRGDPVSVKKMMGKVRMAVENGNSIMMFPEGTRYPGGRLGAFREGAFRMAIENKTDIIPILLDGTARALPKRGAVLTGFTKIRVRVFDPISHNSFSEMEPAELMNQVREFMSEEYRKIQTDE
jgi:1-acyl-sn-glycerol-3-phosphate acyltransferase